MQGSSRVTQEQLQTLIQSGENLEVEFKGESRSALNDRALVEAVVCLANRTGGGPAWLLIGVEDDGTVTGARPRHDGGKTEPRRLQALIGSRTQPSLSCRVDVVDLHGLPVIAVEVPASRTPISTADGVYLRRALGHTGQPQCLPMSFYEMQSLQASRGSLDYTGLDVHGATWNDLDPLEFARFRRRIEESRGQGDRSLLTLSDVELAKALGAVRANHEVTSVKVLGLLLFGKEEALRQYVPSHEVAFQVLRGTVVEVNDFMRWPLVRVIEEIETRYRALNREVEITLGMTRLGIPDFPERAVREALANALIHRDYATLGTVHVQWHQDALVFSNPGGFPQGIHLDNLLVAPPTPRNPALADAFKRAAIVERTGRGIDILFEEQLRNGRPAPSYQNSTDRSVQLILPGGAPNLEFVQMLFEEARAGASMRLVDLLVMNQLWFERRLNVHDAARLLQRSEAEARGVIERLVEAGLVEARGDGRSRYYHLAPGTYRKLGQKAEYVRQSGFEPLQQEQMVLRYVREHGRITRRETAELCRISPFQASRLLLGMVKNDLLQAGGRGKGAFYELRS